MEKKEIQKKKKSLTIIAYILMALESINIIYFVLFTFVDSIHSNWYLTHLAIPFGILFVGLIALLIPAANKYASYRSSNTHDKYISLGGIILIFAALIMFVGSFM